MAVLMKQALPTPILTTILVKCIVQVGRSVLELSGLAREGMLFGVGGYNRNILVIQVLNLMLMYGYI